MKKWIISLGTTMAVAVVVLGCSQATIADTDSSAAAATTPSAYLSIVKAQQESAQLAVEAVSRYVDLPTQNGRSASDEALSFEDIGNYLPDDLSTLTRIVPGRSAGEQVEVTLEQELDNIAQNFQNQLDKLLPDPTAALTLPFVAGSEEGLVIGGDTIIPYRSLEGAVTVEVLNAMARGEDVETLVQNMERELESEFGAATGRGVVKAADGRWPDGMVNYRWGKNITEQHKNAVLAAMRTWSTATGNKVRFRELPNNSWTNHQLLIHAMGVVLISTENLPDRVTGRAHTGYGGGWRILQIDKDVNDTEGLQRVPLHELGHVLGLYHEHQRWNRDQYITVSNPSDTENFGIIPKEISGLRWQWLRIRIGWWTIRIPLLIWRSKTISYTTGEFDFKSIMLYGGLQVRPGKQYLNDGNQKTMSNTTLSPHDIEMVKQIY